ncbi:hypothetical protein KIPB_015000, partial [Kipferlia bialata]|eukprot:g15000.t1
MAIEVPGLCLWVFPRPAQAHLLGTGTETARPAHTHLLGTGTETA